MRVAALISLVPLFWQYPHYGSRGTGTATFNTTDSNICVTSERAARAATLLAQSPHFDSAVASIQKAQSISYKEYVISFGRDSSGNVVRSSIATGNMNNGSIPSINNRFADIHIHTNEQPPSSGDLYGFIDQLAADSNYVRFIITPKGQAYALVLVNKEEAFRFNRVYARRPGIRSSQNGTSTNYQPTFPPQLVDEFNQLKAWGAATPEMALAFLLKKYNAGIALLKQNSKGIYSAFNVFEKIDHKGNKTYLLSHCL